MKKDSSFNVYRQRKISFEDRVVVEGSKTSSFDQYGAGPKHGQYKTWTADCGPRTADWV